jgi:hypothetical protein
MARVKSFEKTLADCRIPRKKGPSAWKRRKAEGLRRKESSLKFCKFGAHKAFQNRTGPQ